MGASCFKATEPLLVIGVEQVSELVLKQVREALIEELRTKIIPMAISALNQTEDKLDHIIIYPHM